MAYTLKKDSCATLGLLGGKNSSVSCGLSWVYTAAGDGGTGRRQHHKCNHTSWQPAGSSSYRQLTKALCWGQLAQTTVTFTAPVMLRAVQSVSKHCLFPHH